MVEPVTDSKLHLWGKGISREEPCCSSPTYKDVVLKDASIKPPPLEQNLPRIGKSTCPSSGRFSHRCRVWYKQPFGYMQTPFRTNLFKVGCKNSYYLFTFGFLLFFIIGTLSSIFILITMLPVWFKFSFHNCHYLSFSFCYRPH